MPGARGWRWDESNSRLEVHAEGQVCLRYDPVASAVNLIEVVPGATGNQPDIQAVGTDTNIGITLTTLLTGWVVQRSSSLDSGGGSLAFQKIITTDTTAGALTHTVAMLRGGILSRDPNGAARSDVTPTAADMIADIVDAVTGTSFWYLIDNTGAATEDLTMTAGTTVTMQGTNVIGDTKAQLQLVTFTSGTAVSWFGLGDVA